MSTRYRRVCMQYSAFLLYKHSFENKKTGNMEEERRGWGGGGNVAVRPFIPLNTTFLKEKPKTINKNKYNYWTQRQEHKSNAIVVSWTTSKTIMMGWTELRRWDGERITLLHYSSSLLHQPRLLFVSCALFFSEWSETKSPLVSERSGKIFHTFCLGICLLWQRWLWLWRQRRRCSSAPKCMKKWNLCQWQKEENEKQWNLKATVSGACKTNSNIPYSTRQDIQYFRVCNV